MFSANAAFNAGVPSSEEATWLSHFGFAPVRKSFVPWASGATETGQDVEPEESAPEPEKPVLDEEALRAEGFTFGFEEGRRTVELEIAEERAALAQLARSLEVLQPEPTTALAALLAETVERLVREIVGSVEIDGELLIARAQRAAALIGEETQPSRLFVHPDDLHLLVPAHLPVELAPDPSLARGSVKLECATGWVEDGPEVCLDRLRVALGNIGAPE